MINPLNNPQKLAQIIERCQLLLNRYGSDINRINRMVRVIGVGNVRKHQTDIIISGEGIPTLNLNLINGFNGSYPSVEQLDQVMFLLDRMENQIKAVYH